MQYYFRDAFYVDVILSDLKFVNYLLTVDSRGLNNINWIIFEPKKAYNIILPSY